MDQTKKPGTPSREEPEYEYYVWPERRILLRVSLGAVEQFCPVSEEEWQARPALEGLRYGNGDFDYFIRVREEEALSAAARFREAAKR
ncbi:MAG: hypothetical protein IKO25_01055 [Clostridia bacterium]|nr:hypothetical protein [Clostridia bacterium]